LLVDRMFWYATGFGDAAILAVNLFILSAE
jgi:hypothetical protein